MIVGTTQFSLPPNNRWDGLFTPKLQSVQSPLVGRVSREDNGRSKVFTLTIDPSKSLFLGAKFSLLDVTVGILMDTFGEGTEFLSPTGRVRIMGGKLRYTRNKALYKLPSMRI